MWKVCLTSKASKQRSRLREKVQQRFDLLMKELEIAGPLRANWPSFGAMMMSGRKRVYHCHIKNGRPTYVACWEVIASEIRVIEVFYVGTHEKAPY